MRHGVRVAVLRLFITSCAFVTAVAASAERNSPVRLEQFARLPDWSGWWEPDVPPGAALEAESFPYSAAWQERYEALKQQLASSDPSPVAIAQRTRTPCVWGFPRVVAGPYRFEVAVTPEQTLFDYQVREFRHIWTDGRGHPPAGVRKASALGHSIGHWDGETLVVDTVRISGASWINGYGAMLSEQAHVTERWTQPDASHLQLQLRIEDPIVLTQPYEHSYYYRRVAASTMASVPDCFEQFARAHLQADQASTVATGGTDAK